MGAIDRVWEGPEAFVRFTEFLERSAALSELAMDALAEVTSYVLEEEVRKGYGSPQLQDLAQSTQDERTRLGYSANEPLLRDGSLLRDSTERTHEHLLAAVGSPEPIAAYHEFGYINARTGQPVPPRPVYKNALEAVEARVLALMEMAAGAALSGKPASITTADTGLIEP